MLNDYVLISISFLIKSERQPFIPAQLFFLEMSTGAVRLRSRNWAKHPEEQVRRADNSQAVAAFSKRAVATVSSEATVRSKQLRFEVPFTVRSETRVTSTVLESTVRLRDGPS